MITKRTANCNVLEGVVFHPEKKKKELSLEGVSFLLPAINIFCAFSNTLATPDRKI